MVGYATDIEAAVYFCCLEALQNSAKHAAGAPVRFGLGEVDSELQFEVAARLRDEISELKKELRQMIEATK